MKIKYIYPFWGSSHLSLEQFFEKVKNAGYDGVEMNIPFDDLYVEKLKKLLDQFGLILIAQQWLEPKIENAGQYILRMEEYLLHLASLHPLFINSHTGRDFFSFEDNCAVFEAANRISKETGIKIVHETHRGRALFSSVNSKKYFDYFPELRINADFSHWCCVSESLLQDQLDFMAPAILRADYIHARVGYEQGPQVNHLESEANSLALKAHLDWWRQILDKAAEEGRTEMAICTEFGPEPYLQTLPFSNKPVGSQWEQNILMKKILMQNLA